MDAYVEHDSCTSWCSESSYLFRVQFDALGERPQVVTTVAAALGPLGLRSWLAKVLSARGVILGPSRSSAPSPALRQRGLGRNAREF
jgi:hypothetical protein